MTKGQTKQIKESETGSVWKEETPDPVWRTWKGEIVCCDALSFLNRLKPGIADIVFLDPPFNLGKSYGDKPGNADEKSDQDYSDFMKRILTHSAEILSPGGALYLYHIPRWALRLGAFAEEFLTLRHWIAVSMKNSFVRPNYLYPAHYALLYFTKGRPANFHRPKVEPDTCRHCGKFVKDYGGYRKYVENGVNLCDIWDDVSPVRHKKYKNREANELPMLIPQRVVQISGVREGLLVDPFAGTGTSLLAAAKQGMRFVACDREQQFCDLMVNRMEQVSKDKNSVRRTP